MFETRNFWSPALDGTSAIVSAAAAVDEIPVEVIVAQLAAEAVTAAEVEPADCSCMVRLS